MEATRPDIIRAAPASSALACCARPLRGFGGRSFFHYSRPISRTTRIKEFWSHSWHGPRWMVVMTVLLLNNSLAALVISTLVSFLLGLFLCHGSATTLRRLHWVQWTYIRMESVGWHGVLHPRFVLLAQSQEDFLGLALHRSNQRVRETRCAFEYGRVPQAIRFLDCVLGSDIHEEIVVRVRACSLPACPWRGAHHSTHHCWSMFSLCHLFTGSFLHTDRICGWSRHPTFSSSRWCDCMFLLLPDSQLLSKVFSLGQSLRTRIETISTSQNCELLLLGRSPVSQWGANVVRQANLAHMHRKMVWINFKFWIASSKRSRREFVVSTWKTCKLQTCCDGDDSFVMEYNGYLLCTDPIPSDGYWSQMACRAPYTSCWNFGVDSGPCVVVGRGPFPFVLGGENGTCLSKTPILTNFGLFVEHMHCCQHCRNFGRHFAGRNVFLGWMAFYWSKHLSRCWLDGFGMWVLCVHDDTDHHEPMWFPLLSSTDRASWWNDHARGAGRGKARGPLRSGPFR